MTQEQIGRYQVIEEIGRGGMATVYRALDPRFKRDVAIKVMTQDLLHDTTLKARFEREAQTIATLEHPAIVPVYDFGEEESRPYLVMRLMSGGTLAERLDQGPLPISGTVKILERIGSALERAHDNGIVHRDLKPSNIMFDDYGDAFLADFGIARLTESAITLTGDSVIGTPAYMSPEQIHGDKAIDGRSDIYALGVICFEMLTGQRPFDDTTPTKVMMRHIMDPIPEIRQVNPNLPEGVEVVITRTMAKEPEDRFSSASEITATLTILLKQERDLEPQKVTRDSIVVATATAISAPETEPEQAVDEIQPSTIEEQPLVSSEVLETEQTSMLKPAFAANEASAGEEIPSPASEDRPRISRRLIAAILIGGFALIFLLAIGVGGAAIISGLNIKPNTAATATPLAAFITDEPTPTSVPDSTATISQSELAEIQIEQFNKLFDEGAYEEALLAINQAIALDPEEMDYLAQRGILFREIGDLEASLADLQQAVTTVPDNPYYHAELSLTHLAMDAIPAALEEINQSIEMAPEGDFYLGVRAEILRTIGDWPLALEDLNNAIEIEDREVWYYDQLAAIYAWNLGEFDQALSYMNQAIELEPSAGWRYNERAIFHRSLGNVDAALEDHKEAIQLDSEDVWNYLQRAITYRDYLGDFEAAMAEYDRVLSVDPLHPDVHAERGYFFQFIIEDFESALAEYNQAIELNPNYSDLYTRRALLHREMGDIDAALADHERAILLNPEDSWAYLERGITVRDYIGDPLSALTDFDRAIEVFPENIDAYLARASVLAWELGEYDTALIDLERCKEINPDYHWCYFDEGWIRDDIGDTDGAVANFRRFLELIPEFECFECQEEAADYVLTYG